MVDECSLEVKLRTVEVWKAEALVAQAWCPRMNNVPMCPDILYTPYHNGL